jgi:uncharacterized protein YdaU (DUF1376 family)
MEDLAYRRLLDFYYDSESPIPNDIPRVSRVIRMDAKDVETVLRDFFTLGENGYTNLRADDEIAQYMAYLAKQQANGKLGGRPKKTHRKPTDNPSLTQAEPKITLTTTHKPITNNQKKTSDQPDGFETVYQAYPKKVGKPAALKAWKAQRINGEWQDILADVEKRKMSDDWLKNNGQYVPNPATYLNQRRWEDVDQNPQPERFI